MTDQIQIIDPEVIKGYIREINRDKPQYKGIWYSFHPAIENEFNISYWKLESEEGYAMMFNADIFRLDECFEKFFDTLKNDPDWNYGKIKL